jgi:glycogen operon protein
LERNRGIFEFVRGMIAFRTRHPVLSREQFYRPEDLSWFNPSGWIPDWEADTAVGCHIHCEASAGQQLCILFNPMHHTVNFVLPKPPQQCIWARAIDTAATAPFDVCPEGGAVPLYEQESVLLPERSLVVLIGEPDPRRS